jgi:hypothetical protein
MKRIFLLLLLVAPLALAAVDKTVTWIPPAERVNGDPLAPAEIAGYDLECSELAGAIVYQANIPPGTSHETGEVFDSGEFVCRMRTIDTDGRLSDWGSSNVFTVGRCDVTDCRPTPPRSITVTVP